MDRSRLKRPVRIRELRHLAMRLGESLSWIERLSSLASQMYSESEKVSASGKRRVISKPHGALKAVQRKVASLLSGQGLPPYFHGGVSGRSARSNACQHLDRELVQPFDLCDFFAGVSSRVVYERLVSECECSPDVARLVTRLITRNGSLPQGGPASCAMAAIVLLPAAERIAKLADEQGWSFTVYVDDITVSGPRRILGFRRLLYRILKSEGFSPHDLGSRKSRAMSRDEEQLVTGQRVNGRRLGVPCELDQRIRDELASLKIRAAAGELPNRRSVRSLLGLAIYVREIDPHLAGHVLSDLEFDRWRQSHRL